MIDYLISTIFGLALAITSGGILIASHLRTTYRADFLSSLLFFQVFWFTFGFYAIWGQILVSSFLASFVSPELLKRITDIMVLLGSPFIIFASLMFLRFSRELSGRKTGNRFILWYVLINIMIIAGLGFIVFKYNSIQALAVIRYYFILLSFFYTITGLFCFLSPKPGLMKIRELKNMAFVLMVLMIINNALLLFYDTSIFIALLFIFSFFIYGSFIPVYMRFRANLSRLMPNQENGNSFEFFCDKYAISPREKDVLDLLVKGKSYNQIGEELYISLPTVKTHISNIYRKFEVNNKVELINLLNSNNYSTN